jgi:hypothetical protein
MAMKRIFMTLVAGVLLISCSPTKNEGVVGNATDKHGCQITAGYTWSEIRKDCIRLFEDAQCIGSIREGSSLLNVYVVFSSDKSKAELFLPSSKNNPILIIDGKQWKGNGYVLSKSADKYILTKDGKEISLQ